MNVVVFDDFYRQPDKVHALALSAEYRDVTQLNYPGYQSVHTYVTDGLRRKFAAILDRELDIPADSKVFGKFRIMLRESGSRLKVHLDGGTDWTGVLYLTRPELCMGGTAFFRHRQTGLEGPIHGPLLKKFGAETWADLEERLIAKDTLNADAWEQTLFVGMKYNRLVLFKGNQMFHCHTHSFGDSKANGRITQNFFFDESHE